MIPSLLQPRILSRFSVENSLSQIVLDPNFESLSFLDKLKSIGLIDNNFKLLFTPSKIPSISNLGQKRLNHLMEREVLCCTKNNEVLVRLKHSEYISGFTKVLAKENIATRSYLRGGYAAYVACLADYLESLIHEYLTKKNLRKDLFKTELQILKNQDLTACEPHDVDLFDHILADNVSLTKLRDFHIGFLAKNGDFGRIKTEGFIQLLIPTVSPVFPYAEEYVLFTAGNRNGPFQTDRIIGKLHHEYLYSRDDIRIDLMTGNVSASKCGQNFWQMVIDRNLKIVRTEPWHEQDFRAGLAALQLIQDDHFLLDEHCRIDSIIKYALFTNSDKVFKGAVDRAKLHSKNHYGFLMSVLIAYSHVANLNNITIPDEHLNILTKAILKTGNTIPPLANLYQLALLLLYYEDQTNTCSAKWDPAGTGLLTLYVNGNRIVFPKNFSLASKESYFSLNLKPKTKPTPFLNELIYELLEKDDSLGYLERVLFELALKKPLTPFTESLLNALTQYLIQNDIADERVMLASCMPEEFSNAYTNLDWIKALLKYSFKHAIALWNASKITMDDVVKWKAFEAIIDEITPARPNQAYVLIEEESPPKELRLKLLKILTGNESLSRHTSVKIIDELLEGDSLDYLERVLFELAWQNTPLTESAKEALVQYLKQPCVDSERVMIASRLPKEFSNAHVNLDWIKTLLNYSFKHGLKLWNASKVAMTDVAKWQAFEAIIDQIVSTRPNQAYVLIEEEELPKALRLKLLKKLTKNESLSFYTSIKIIDKCIKEHAAGEDIEPFIIQTIKNLPPDEGFDLGKKLPSSLKILATLDPIILCEEKLLEGAEEWIFKANPSQERMKNLFLNTGGSKKAIELFVKWIEWKISLGQLEEASTAFQNHHYMFKDDQAVYIKFIKQFHLETLAKAWIESFPPQDRIKNVLLFFSRYTSTDHPLLETICSLPGLNKKDVLETLHKQDLPVFFDRDIKDLLSLVNSNFSDETKKVILTLLAGISDLTKELKALERFMKANPLLSLHLISGLLEKQNDDFLPIITSQLINLKTTKHLASKEDSFPPLWKKTLDRNLAIPQMLLALIPFYKNLGWIKSVYGTATASETRRWAKALGKQEKLTESDKVIIKEILSRTKLKSNAEFILTKFLESLNLLKDGSAKTSFHLTLARLLVHINTDSTLRRYQFEILLRLIKLGMSSKFLTINAFKHIKDAMACAPLLVDARGSFDPVFHLLQNLPLVDYESESVYQIWNEERSAVFEAWEDISVLNQKTVRELLGPRMLKTIPYENLQEILKYTHLFKLITEQFIEGKVTKEDFLSEAKEIALSIEKKFESQELIPNEDPCLICINDFTHFLKIQNSKERERAYSAFKDLIYLRKISKDVKSKFLDKQLHYLNLRKKTEDLIISNLTRYSASQILYSNYMSIIHSHLIEVCKSCPFEDIHFQDPILDAFAIELLHPILKLDFLRLWINELKREDSIHSTYHVKKIESILAFEHGKLKEGDRRLYFEKKINILKKAQVSKNKKQTEGVLILASAATYLPEMNIIEIHQLIEKKLDIKIPLEKAKLIETSLSQKTEIKKTNIKSYLEHITNQPVGDQKIHDIYHESTICMVNLINNEEPLQYYSFAVVLNLLKLGIESKVLSSNYFTLMRMMINKAPHFLLEAYGQVVEDPYVRLLQSLSLIDMGSEKEMNELNTQREEFLDYWIKQLKTSEKQSIISYAERNITLECLPYEKLKLIREYIRRFKSAIEDFIHNKVHADIFMKKMSLLCTSAFQSIRMETFSVYTDPCLATLKELSYLLHYTSIRNQVYAAFHHLIVQWCINLKTMPQYITELRTYLTSRRSIEDVVSRGNHMFAADFIQSLFENSIPSNIHNLDPVVHALELDSLSIFDTLPLLQNWGNKLSEYKTPSAQYQAKSIFNYIEFERKKIKEEDAEKVIKEKLEEYKAIKHMLTPKETKKWINHISHIGGTLLSTEKIQPLITQFLKNPNRTTNYNKPQISIECQSLKEDKK